MDTTALHHDHADVPAQGPARPKRAKTKRQKKRNAGSGATADAAADIASNDMPKNGPASDRPADASDAATVNADAAAWDAKREFPEGDLDAEARKQIREAIASLKPVKAAIHGYETSLGRSEDALRRVLAKIYRWGIEYRDQPEVVNGLLEKHRIKPTAPVRANVFLALSKVTRPHETADTHSRQAGALGYLAAQGCTVDEVPAFLKTHGIRECADAWTEIRKRAKRTAARPQKPDPIDVLRAGASAVVLPDDTPTPADHDGPFLVIAERSADGLIALGSVSEPRIVAGAVKRAARDATASFPKN